MWYYIFIFKREIEEFKRLSASISLRLFVLASISHGKKESSALKY